MAMAWQPEQEQLRQLSACLKDSLSGHNKNAQKQAEIVSGDGLRLFAQPSDFQAFIGTYANGGIVI